MFRGDICERRLWCANWKLGGVRGGALKTNIGGSILLLSLLLLSVATWPTSRRFVAAIELMSLRVAWQELAITSDGRSVGISSTVDAAWRPRAVLLLGPERTRLAVVYLACLGELGVFTSPPACTLAAALPDGGRGTAALLP